MPNGRIIVIAGIKRSASTVMFNICRIALEQAGYTVNICDETYDPRTVPDNEIDLVKIHPFRYELAKKADAIFLTQRSQKEIKASWQRFYGKKITENEFQQLVNDLNQWKIFSNIPVFNYSFWLDDPLIYICKVIQYLQVDVFTESVSYEFSQIELPQKGQDPQTLLFHNHITSK